MKQGQPSRDQGLSKGGGEILGSLYGFSPGAIGPGQGGKIRVSQIGGHGPSGMAGFLMHADGAVHAVVDDDHYWG